MDFNETSLENKLNKIYIYKHGILCKKHIYFQKYIKKLRKHSTVVKEVSKMYQLKYKEMFKNHIKIYITEKLF